MSSTSVKVLIIGAGPGGLVLAHVLRKHKIVLEIFERDSADHVRPQGWAVALHDSIPALRASIPDTIKDIHTISVNAPLGVYDSIGVLNEDGTRLPGGGGVSEGEPGHILRVKRERLRDYLWQDLPVQMGKHFTHYSEDDDGVTAYFADGTSARGSILVGADGAHSHVRKQLLDLEAQNAPYIPVVGSGSFPREIYGPIHSVGSGAVAVGGEGLRMIISPLSIDGDGSHAHYYWAAMRKSAPNKDIVWAASASKDEMYAHALECTANTPDIIKKMIQATGVDGMMKPPLKFVEFSPPDTFPRSRVIVLGDAAHSMMPFKGAGVNTAIQDACDFGDIIGQEPNLDDKEALLSALQAYAKIVIDRGQKMVAASHAAGEDMSQHLGGKTK